MAPTTQQIEVVQPQIQGNPGFETILALPRRVKSMVAEENYCPDCFDSCENDDTTCDGCDCDQKT